MYTLQLHMHYFYIHVQRGFMALHHACFRGHLNTVKMLLEEFQCDPHKSGVVCVLHHPDNMRACLSCCVNLLNSLHYTSMIFFHFLFKMPNFTIFAHQRSYCEVHKYVLKFTILMVTNNNIIFLYRREYRYFKW